jgi:hypothetical protein
MNSVELLLTALLTVLVGSVIALAILYVRARRSVASGSQQATANENSMVKQAGRDLLDIGGSVSTATHISPSEDLYLAYGEQLATAADRAEFTAQISQQWAAAESYVAGVSIYGRAFMPPEDELATMLRRGVALRMVLLDPETQAAQDFAIDKCRFSRTVQQSDILSRVLGISTFDPEFVLARVREEVTGTVAMISKIKNEYPDVDVQVRYIDFLPLWKGTIVDGASAVYVIYDVPRLDAPFRLTFDRKIINYYEDKFANLYFRQGTEVVL